MPVAPHDVTKALEAAEPATALDVLLRAWREAPQPDLADRITSLGATLRTPVDKKTWATLAAKHDAKDLSALLDAALDGTVKTLRERVEQLEAWPADPRLDRFVAHAYTHPPFTSTGARPFWTRIVALGLKVRDQGALGAMKAARATWNANIPWQEFLIGHVERIARLADVPPSPPTSAEWSEALAGVDAFVARAHSRTATVRSVDALMSDVLARPDLDEPRRVLMDALLEEGHPRGELLALHFGASGRALATAERKQERALIKKHRAALLGPLDGVLAAELEFKRGFLSSARIKGGTSNALKLAITRSVGEPMWATVEHLSGADGELVMHEVMRSLTSLDECDAPLEALGRLSRLEALLGARVSEEKHVAALTAAGAFPGLRRLHARGYPWSLAKVVQWPRTKTFESLGLEVHASSPLGDEHLGLLRRALTLGLPELVFTVVRYDSLRWGTTCRFTPGAVHFEVKLGNLNWHPLVLPDVLAVLEVCKPLGLAVTLDDEGVDPSELREQVRRAVKSAHRGAARG